MRRILSIVTLLVLSTFWTGCIRSDSESSGYPEGQNLTLTVQVLLPGSSTDGSTRTETSIPVPAIEKDINQLDLLVFKYEAPDAQGKEVLTYYSHHTGVITPMGGIQTYRFANVYPEGEGFYGFLVFIANAHDDVVTALESINKGDALNSVFETLNFETGNGWMAQRSKNTNLMPMYGQMSNVLLQEDMGATLLTVTMLRSVARVDVLNSALLDGQTTPLGIKEVRVVNTMNQGSLIPNRGDSFDEANPNPSVTAPNIPAEAVRLKVSDAITQVGTPIQKQSQNTEETTPEDESTEETIYEPSITGIYVSESEVDDLYLKRNCVLINIPQEVEKQTKDCWYRVDLQEKKSDQTEAEPCAILRNRHYTINIRSINSLGFDTPDEAFENVSVGLDCSIREWDMGAEQDVIFNGGYSLEIDRSEVTLYNEYPTANVTVTTTCKDGWSVADEDKSSWIQLNTQSGKQNESVVVEISGSLDDLAPDASREGYFWIQAGNIRKKVVVTQINRANELSLELSPETVYFSLSPKKAQTVTATYSPTDAQLTMEVTPGDPGITDSDWAGEKPVLNGTVVSLLPKEFSTADGTERTATLTFTLTSADEEKSISKTVKVIQSGESAFFEVAAHDPIGPQETDVTFMVKSAVDWSLKESTTIEEDVDPTKPIDLVTWNSELQLSNESGANYTVTVPANQTWAERTWYFVPTSEHESWPQSGTSGENIEGQEFPYGTWTVEQLAATPALEVTPTTVDFGSGAEPARIPVTISTNAKWYYTLPSTNTWVVGTAEAPYATVSKKNPYGKIDTPATTNEYDIYFGSTAFAVNGSNIPEKNQTIPAAGSATATVTFSTLAGTEQTKADLQQQSQEVTFKRTVPGFLRPLPNEAELDVYPYELKDEQSSVTLRFQTNAPWEAGYIINGEEVMVEEAKGLADSFGERTTELQIQNRSEWLLPIPNPNAGSRPLEVFVRPQQGTLMAENEPTQLSYNLKVKKNYISKAELRVNGNLITPPNDNSDVSQLEYNAQGYQAQVDIVGNFSDKKLWWGGDLKELKGITLTDGQAGTYKMSYVAPTWWGVSDSYSVRLEHGWMDNIYDGFLDLGNLVFQGYGGELTGPTAPVGPTDQSFTVTLKAKDGWGLPDNPKLYVTGGPSFNKIFAPIQGVQSSDKITYTVYCEENKNDFSATYVCKIKGPNFGGDTKQPEEDQPDQLTLLVRQNKPENRPIIEDPDNPGTTYGLVELDGGMISTPLWDVTKTPKSGCESVVKLTPGKKLVFKGAALKYIDKFAASTFKRGPWIFADAPFTMTLRYPEGWGAPRPMVTNGPRVSFKKLDGETLQVTAIQSANSVTSKMSGAWYANDYYFGIGTYSFVLCVVRTDWDPKPLP